MSAIRDVLSDLLGRRVDSIEELDDTARDLVPIVEELKTHRRIAAEGAYWSFGKVPELVVSVVDDNGSPMYARLAGGVGRADLTDSTQRRYARMLIEIATEHLDATEPARATEGRSL